MLSENEILYFISADEASERKKSAKTGLAYYEGDHDIKNYKLYYFNDDGNLVEDKTRSNIKISHPFFTELVDQQVQYMLSGKDGFMKSDIPELQNILDERFNENEDFCSEFYETVTGAIAKGFDYMYLYKNKNDELSFQNADGIGVIEVDPKDADDGEEHIIYWYVDKADKGQKAVKRIEVWDKAQTFFYVSEKDGEIKLDETKKLTPVPMFFTEKEDGGELYYEEFGFVPFFRLDNCRKQYSALKPIKNIIDDYDLMSCGLSNNLQDASEYLVVVKGFDGNNVGELIQNVKTKKHIGIPEAGGDVDFKTVDIPYDARKVKLELDETNIYRFGMGFNSAQIGDGNITNIVIKSRYALLDLKCNKLEIRLKQFLRKILKVVLDDINETEGTDYQQKDVYFKFEREVMTNAQDNATIEEIDARTEQTKINTMLNLAGTLDDETIMQNICEILDINYEDIKNKLPEPEVDPVTAANEIPVDDAV